MGKKAREPEYSDWLKHFDDGGEFRWIVRSKEFPVNTSVKARPRVRNGKEIKKDVLHSPRVQEAIREECAARKWSKEAVTREAEEILETMGHEFDMKSVKVIGYFVTKVVRQIFDAIYVNFDQLKKVREICKTDSVVFIPSHKSYMDFLLLSLLCFDQEVPLPAIVAGMDFLNSKFMGEALRRCGAFFIRRSFGSDKLYWALFTEYVQTHLVNSDRPVEFFVEGTRSRVGKSLFPKYGLMQVMLEPYLRGQVYDLVVVPVAINYDKILEELLYGYELLGFPKPKESASGLLKARQILDKSFGRCYVTFCEPISVRKHFGTSVHRSAFVCQPDSQFVLSECEKRAIRKFGHLIVKEHNKNSVVSVWPFACQAILTFLDDHEREDILFSELLQNVRQQLSVMERLAVAVQVEKSIQEDLRYYVKLHDDLFHPIDHGAEDYVLRLLSQKIEKSENVAKNVLERSVGLIVINNYANKMMHELSDEALISAILQRTSDHKLHIVYAKFKYLQSALAREFVCVPGEDFVSFSAAVDRLSHSQIVEVFEETLRVLDEGSLRYLAELIQPFLCSFDGVVRSLSASAERHVTLPQVVAMAQKWMASQHSRRVPGIRLSFLSTDPLKNAFSTLADLSVVVRKAKNFEVNFSLLDQVEAELRPFVSSARGNKL